MAQISNTFETYDAVGNREELADRIYRITPQETPVLSLISHGPVQTTHPEWQIDTLATPAANAQPEGDDWSYDARSPTTRPGTYTQISNKTVIISRTQDKTNKAGRRTELAYQVEKMGRELRIDIERVLISNTASNAGTGNAATNRETAGMRAWIASNDNLGATGASGGFNTSTSIVDAATNGTQRAFTKALLDSTILSTYNAGGNPTTLIVSPYVKTVFSTFLDDANVVPLRTQANTTGKNTLIASAEIYHSDFGNISVMPNRQMARAGASFARNAFLLDTDMWMFGVFDDIKLVKPAKTGDAEKRVLITEYALISKNEAASGVVADLFGLSATT